MPERRKRAGLYIRESDIGLSMDSTTVESALKALLEHAQRKNYDVSSDNIYKEAISGYSVHYFDRPELMRMLKAAERGEFDILLVTEIRALSRKGAGEVIIIYSTLQKANVQLETLNETITDDPMGEVLLSFRATWARVEREQSYLRMQRGKKDRIEIGNAPPNGRECYGYVLVDTDKEVKGRYEYDTRVIYTDSLKKKWSKIKVREFILECLLRRETLRSISMRLNDLGIPPPKKAKKGDGAWIATTVRRIAENTINCGDVYVNKYKRVEAMGKNGKRTTKLVPRPREEWILLPGIAPTLISREEHQMILENMRLNKEESLRNNKYPHDLGLLRGGFIFCGVCGKRMTVRYGASRGATRSDPKPAYYRCFRREGKTCEAFHNHNSIIGMKLIDNLVKQKIIEALSEPEVVRQKVMKLREENKEIVNETEITETLVELKRKMQNLFKLAEGATDDDTILSLKERMHELEVQKRETEKLLYVVEDDAEERAKIEAELTKFETWAQKVQPCLTNTSYMETATQEELRLAMRILGLRAIIYPRKGDYELRHEIIITAPQILAKGDIECQSSRV